MPWSEHKPKLPSAKKRPFRSQHVGPYIRDFIRCSNFGIARDFDVPLHNLSPPRRRTIPSRVHSKRLDKSSSTPGRGTS